MNDHERNDDLYDELNDALRVRYDRLSTETQKVLGLLDDPAAIAHLRLLWEKQWWEQKALELAKKLKATRP